MTYFEQLQTEEWQEKRNGILSRDKHTCQNCQNEKYMQYSGSPATLRKTDDEYHYYNLEIRIDEGVIKVKKNDKFLEKVFIYYNDRGKWSDCIAIRMYDIKDDNDYLKKRIYRSMWASQFEKSKQYFREAYNIRVNPIINFIKKEGFLNEINKKEFDQIINAVKESAINDITKHFSLNASEVKYYLETEDTVYKYPKNEFRDNFKWLYAKNLHIHHKYYQQGKKAWEYPDDALVTLCWNCHEELHENEEIDVYDIYGNLIGTGTPCSRCHGAGYLPEYNHVENGICFKCNGARFEDFVSKGI